MIDRLFKVAYQLDNKGLYDEAKAIDEVMHTMAKRVGLKPEEIASVADFLDEQGDTALAAKFDSMLQKLANK